jgi:methyl-CpG-binding domain protein 4
MPPRSPFGLIQEDLWPNEWRILIACQMLNCTTRRQVEKVINEFFEEWPTPLACATANVSDVSTVIKSLGFANRRANNLVKMSHEFMEHTWKHARELTGIGDYAARAWEIFCLGKLGDDEPNDGALSVYWKWRKLHGRQGNCKKT